MGPGGLAEAPAASPGLQRRSRPGRLARERRCRQHSPVRRRDPRTPEGVMEKDTAFQMAASNIRFGAGTTAEVGMDLAELGARRVLLVIDPALVDDIVDKFHLTIKAGLFQVDEFREDEKLLFSKCLSETNVVFEKKHRHRIKQDVALGLVQIDQFREVVGIFQHALLLQCTQSLRITPGL